MTHRNKKKHYSFYNGNQKPCVCVCIIMGPVIYLKRSRRLSNDGSDLTNKGLITYISGLFMEDSD